jgi:hypothetical protein
MKQYKMFAAGCFTRQQVSSRLRGAFVQPLKTISPGLEFFTVSLDFFAQTDVCTIDMVVQIALHSGYYIF